MYNRISALDDMMKKVHDDPSGSRQEILELLSLKNGADIERLYLFADKVRNKFMGDGVFLRGLVEFSNRCQNSCFYCGLNRQNTVIERYAMTADEVLAAVSGVNSMGIKTVVLQSGEDEGLDPVWLAGLIKEIKKRFDMAVTISVGEKSRDDYKLWREAGADRYLLKVETTDSDIYSGSHSGRKLASRLKCLEDLIDLGYQTGSGMLIGLRGQTPGSIAEDILFLERMKFDMIGIGPFIPHGDSVFAGDPYGDVGLTLKALAVTRIVTKDAHMPATTAIGSSGGDHRVEALKAGANVLMPNFTPVRYKKLYEIYPGKACVSEEAKSCVSCMDRKARSADRFVDYSAGHSFKKNRIFNKEEVII